MALKCVFFSVFFSLFYAGVASAQISVPDYSFTGKEITGFIVKPGYTSVDFDFKLPSKMDVYLQKRHSEFTASDKRSYSADEPGAMYSGPVSTSVSSIFVGDKAYRNNIVKMFLNKDYIDVISSYGKYSEKLAKSEFKDEVLFLYGMSLYETGSRREAFGVLDSLSSGLGPYGEIAQDSLFQKLEDLKQWNAMENAAFKIEKFSPYSLAVWLKYLNSTDRYEEILKLLDNYKDFEENYPDFTNLRVSALYFLRRYKEAASLEPQMKGTASYPLVIDALIMTGTGGKARQAAVSLPDSEVKTILLSKINISEDKLKAAATGIKAIKDDKEKLALFFYAVNNKFNVVTPEFLSHFFFSDKQYNDYVNFYLGLKYLSLKKYSDSLNKFAVVAFNKELVTASYFYQGMAAIHIDTSRAEWNFMRFINSGSDIERVMLSKFMLSQIYFMKSRYDEALMLVDDCSADYCRRLKADLFLAKGQYNKSLDISSGLKDDRALLIRATDFYNIMEYKNALGELVKIKEITPDSEYLLMMSLFKGKRYDDAIEILDKNKSDNRIFSAGVEQLLLAGDGKKALAYFEAMKNLSPIYKVEKAKLLEASGRFDEAEKVYKELLNSNIRTYESLQGLFQIARTKNGTKDFMTFAADFLEKSKPFENNDLLTSLFAGYAMDLNEPNLAIKYVNYFMDNFAKSPYLADVYRTRARLFKFTGRYENCAADADSIVLLDSEALDAVFMKAECMEFVDKNKAVALYRSMAVENGRFFQPASGKLAILSDNPDEVLASAERMKAVSPEIYKSGVIRFLEISDNATFIKHSESIKRLASEGPSDVRSAAVWRIGKDCFDKALYEDAARYYLKGYYLFPKESYAVKNLRGAKASYDARNMKLQSEKAGKLLALYDVVKEPVKAVKGVAINSDLK